MKKIIFALAALLPLLFSCGKPQNTEGMLMEPHFVQYAGQLIPQNEVPASTKAAFTKANPLTARVDFIELTESGIYAIGLSENGSVSYSAGAYTVTGDTYALSGFGTISFSGQPGTVALTITPNGGDARTVNALWRRGTGSDPVHRGWTVEKTRIKVGNVGADFKGLNLGEIANFLKTNGYDIPSGFPTASVSTLSITAAGSFILAYTDGAADVATFGQSGNLFSYRWMEAGMGFTVDSGEARLEQMDGRYVLTFSVRMDQESGSIALLLSPID